MSWNLEIKLRKSVSRYKLQQKVKSKENSYENVMRNDRSGRRFGSVGK
jgi:hypothetical protein